MVEPLVAKLALRSHRNLYDVYSYFDWPPEMPRDAYWLSPELLSVHGTSVEAELTEAQKRTLSQFETINLFSVFVQGESDLLRAVLGASVKPQFAEFFPYFTHFIDEENKHMWFFAEFCRRYRGALYPVHVLRTPSSFPDDVEEALAFVRILLFEEMGDYINVRVAADARIPPLLREIHRRHHDDEVGHIAIGWRVARRFLGAALQGHAPQMVSAVRSHLEAYAGWTLGSLYSPSVYADAGLPQPYDLRNRLLNDPARSAAHAKVMRRAHERLLAVWRELGGPASVAQELETQ
ncbi:MAG: hypothetical protein RJA70_2239 [Pseudomonadota bacterium]|jgi:hypothetical protein